MFDGVENNINTETIVQKVTTLQLFSFPPDSGHSLFCTCRLAHLSQQAEVVAGDNDDDSSKTECVFSRAGSARCNGSSQRKGDQEAFLNYYTGCVDIL